MGAPLRVFITGASSGIGKALVLEYANRGATLGLVARRADLLQELARSLPVTCVTYAVDVRDTAALSQACTSFIERHGLADIVIANAGVSTGTLTEHAGDIEVFQETLDINVGGIVKTFQPFLPGMVRARHGALVGIASIAGFRGLPGAGAYSASKAAVISYLESLRVELRGTRVDVITVCPGYIDTPMTQRNPYYMPFLMSAEKAARIIARAIERRQSFLVFPWQMIPVAYVFKFMPRFLYEFFLARAPHKPRREDIR
jgi:short-subunit dehydrogenase